MSDQKPTPESINFKEVSERLIRLEEKIKVDGESFQKRIVAQAGIIALFISISTGSLSIYNAFFVAPNIERKIQVQKLSTAIQEHISRTTEANSLPMSAPLEQRIAAGTGLNNARAALVAELRQAPWDTLSQLSSPDLAASAWVIAESDDFTFSGKLAELAVKKSAGFPEWAAAKNTLARTTLMNNFSEGIVFYNSFLSEIAENNSIWRISSYASAATTETHVLAVTGRCIEFLERVRRHESALRKMNADRNNLQMFIMSAQANEERCDIDGSGSKD